MKNIGIVLIILFFYSCQSKSYNSDSFQAPESTKEMEYYDEMEQSETTNESSKKEERKIIKTAEIRFQVKNLKESTKEIEAISQQFDGRISSMNQTNSNYSINNYLTLRIPSERLNEFISMIEKQSIHTDYTRINAQDVTEEYLDISTRLATKKEVRDRYIEILRNKAKTVKDILDAEEKIRIIQEEIESVEGRLNFLKNKTSLSTINIEMYQEVEYVKSPNVYKVSFFTKVKEGFVNGWELIQDILIGMINIWPILLIFFLIFFGRKRIWGFFRR